MYLVNNLKLIPVQPSHKVKGRRLDVKKAISKTVMASSGSRGRSGRWGNRQLQDWNTGRLIIISTIKVISYDELITNTS